MRINARAAGAGYVLAIGEGLAPRGQMDGISYTTLLGLIPPEHGHLLAVLEMIPPGLRERIPEFASLRSIDRGEVLFAEGARVPEIGYVLDGALGMVKLLPDGRVHIIGLLLPTDVYGRPFDGRTSHRLEALADSTLLCFAREPFEDLLRSAPALERMFLVSLLDELDAAREWILVLNGTHVVQRVAAFLVILARRQAQGQSGRGASLTVSSPLGRKDFARCLGVRPESLSRAIHRLAQDGAIRLLDTNRYEIPDLGNLIEASGQDLVLPERTPTRGGPR